MLEDHCLLEDLFCEEEKIMEKLNHTQGRKLMIDI